VRPLVRNDAKEGEAMDGSDVTETMGRKGVAYDWRSLYAADQASDLDAELTELLSTPA